MGHFDCESALPDRRNWRTRRSPWFSIGQISAISHPIESDLALERSWQCLQQSSFFKKTPKKYNKMGNNIWKTSSASGLMSSLRIWRGQFPPFWQKLEAHFLDDPVEKIGEKTAARQRKSFSQQSSFFKNLKRWKNEPRNVSLFDGIQVERRPLLLLLLLGRGGEGRGGKGRQGEWGDGCHGNSPSADTRPITQQQQQEQQQQQQPAALSYQEKKKKKKKRKRKRKKRKKKKRWIDGHKKTQSKGNQRNEWGSRDGWPLVVNELVMNAIWLECDGTVCDECSVRCWRGVIHQRRLICIWRAASFAYFHHPGWHDGGRRWCGVSITRRWLADNGRGSSP